MTATGFRHGLSGGPFSGKLRWDVEGLDWPHRRASRFVRAASLRWHVQIFGDGERGDGARPTLLLLHGAGAASHSWRGLAPLLADRFTVIAPDLPGHGFSDTPWFSRLSMPGMAAALSELLDALDARPSIAIGHSAGAAIALRMALDGRLAPQGVIGINAALTPFSGAAGLVFPSLAKLLYANPFAAPAVAWSAAYRPNIARLLQEIGSDIDAEGQKLYGRLLSSPGHISGVLGMMAQWDLNPMQRDLESLSVPLLLLAGADDKATPPAQSEAVAARLVAAGRDAELRLLSGLGHLAHEEAPEEIAARVFAFVDWLALSRRDEPAPGVDRTVDPLVDPRVDPNGAGRDRGSGPTDAPATEFRSSGDDPSTNTLA